MIHVYKKGTNNKVIVLLHGTGGNEEDLIPIGSFIDPNAHLIGLRGRINEMGMNRFFKRLSFGVFDEENLEEETKHLLETIKNLIKQYELNAFEIYGLGYSNGANILLSTLYEDTELFKAMMCLHPMKPYKDKNIITKSSNILVTYGKNDQMIPYSATLELLRTLDQASQKYNLFESNFGHQLTNEELQYIKKWYESI